MKKALTISLVIPAYNEESYIEGCLQSALAQTVPFDEIIVVDNNSTDATARLAARFPGVTVVREAQQGVTYARNAGFNRARGDIIARCDGDTIFSPGWVAELQRLFASRPGLAAVSGGVTYREVGAAVAFNAIDRSIRRYLAVRLGAAGEQFLYGVNMAIRRQTWRAVRGEVCHEHKLHEDLDLAAHLSRQGHRVEFAPSLMVSISPRQAASGPHEFFRYTWSNVWVFRDHRLTSVRYIRAMALFVSCLYPAIFVLRRGYNPFTGRFSVSYLLRNVAQTRVSPVSSALTPGD